MGSSLQYAMENAIFVDTIDFFDRFEASERDEQKMPRQQRGCC